MDENELRLELEKAQIEAESCRYEARQKVRQVIFGTMLVGLAAAAFPFAQKLAELIFQERIETIRQRTEINLAERKHEIDTREQRRAFLQSLAEEARSEDIEKRIRLADFYAHLATDEEKKSWKEFQVFLNEKRTDELQRRAAAEAVAGDLTASAETRIAARSTVQSIDRYLNPQPVKGAKTGKTTASLSQPFLMPIEDVFAISGRGIVVTGRVERGAVEVGDEVEIVGIRATRRVTVAGVEAFRRLLDRGEAGDNIGLLLDGIERDDLERGQVLATPGSIAAHKEFSAEGYFLSQEEGGRSTPIGPDYRPQFYFRTTDVTGAISLPAGTEQLLPGESASFTVRLEQPVALEQDLAFAIREGGWTVGRGVVSAILD